MVDYIQLNSLEIQALMDTFGMNDISNFELMEGGAENSSFVVKKGNDISILSICNEKSFDQVHRLAKLLRYLTQKGFPTNRVIESTSGELVINYKEKPVLLKEYLTGNVCEDINYNMLFKLGALIGKLHQIPPPEYLPKCFPYGIDSFSEVFSKFPQLDYSKWLREKSEYIRRGLSLQLPTGLVHGDIFLDNVLFKNENLVGIIDFEEACNYYFLFDLGMCVVGTCVEGGSISLDKTKSLLAGYESVRKLEDTEREMLPLFSEYAAVATSFWRFRHHFITYPQSQKENYLEMVAIANYIHKNSSSFHNLYL